LDHESQKLQKLLYRKVKMVSNEVLKTNGRLSDSQLSTLENLFRLTEITNATQPPPRKWLVLAIIIFTLSVVSLLVFVRMPETDIELDLTLSGISFVLPKQQELVDAMTISELGISGLEKIVIPRARGSSEKTISSDNGFAGIKLSHVIAGSQSGSITLAPLVLKSDSQIWLRRTEVAKQFRLSLKNSEMNLKAFVNGAVRVGLWNAQSKQFDFQRPRSFIFQPKSSNPVNLDLIFHNGNRRMFSSQLSIKKLHLFRIENFSANEIARYPRQVSTILSGKLYLESLNGKELKIRPHETIRFEESFGMIRRLVLENDQIHLNFRGRVRGMKAGVGAGSRSLMPTILEWLRARHSISLLWGTTFYLFGIFILFLRWWKIVKGNLFAI